MRLLSHGKYSELKLNSENTLFSLWVSLVGTYVEYMIQIPMFQK